MRISGSRPALSSLPSALTIAGFQTRKSESYSSLTAERVTILSELQAPTSSPPTPAPTPNPLPTPTPALTVTKGVQSLAAHPKARPQL